MNYQKKIDYRYQKQKQLKESIDKYKKIYLDINFWIRIRDAHVKRTKDIEITKLYNKLTELVIDDKIICPISPIVIDEVLKQSGEPEFIETVEIIDKFSRNVVTITEKELALLEFKHIFDKCLNKEFTFNVENYIWTKTIDIFGHKIPQTHELTSDPEKEIYLYKSYLDYAWNKTLSEMIKSSKIGIEKFRNYFNLEKSVVNLNQNNEAHKNEFNTFDELLKIERSGMLDVYKLIAWKAYERSLLNTKMNYSNEEKLSLFKSIMYKSIDSENQIPGIIEIPAGIHSLIRYESRKYKEFNDFFDFHHAYIAIPYFDFLFTEKKLSNIVKHNRLNYGLKYKCQIEYKLSNILLLLEKYSE